FRNPKRSQSVIGPCAALDHAAAKVTYRETRRRNARQRAAEANLPDVYSVTLPHATMRRLRLWLRGNWRVASNRDVIDHSCLAEPRCGEDPERRVSRRHRGERGGVADFDVVDP